MISFLCDACGRTFSVPDGYAGRQARCACKAMLSVPSQSTVAAAPPVAAAVASTASTVGAATTGGLRARRLTADQKDMRETFADGTLGRIVSTRGEPPELYVVELRVASLVDGSERAVVSGDVHQLEIQLLNDYPRVGPKCRMLTPIFHPNIDASSVCIGDHWAAGERLSDLVIRVAEMLAFQAYNIRSPLNAVAAMWADVNADQLPTDRRNLREVLGR